MRLSPLSTSFESPLSDPESPHGAVLGRAQLDARGSGRPRASARFKTTRALVEGLGDLSVTVGAGATPEQCSG